MDTCTVQLWWFMQTNGLVLKGTCSTWNELRAGLRVLRWGSKVVCRKPRLQAAEPTLKSAIRIPGFDTAFLMLGFTAFLGSRRRLVFGILGLLVDLQGRRLGGVGEDEVDEDGGEEEEAAHHGEGQGEASNLVQSATDDRSNNLSCGFTFTTLHSLPSVTFLFIFS